MKRTSNQTNFVISLLCASVLAACGGGSDGNFLGENSQHNNFGGGAGGKPLDPVNQVPHTTQKFLVDMKDEGQQTKKIVASVDDDGDGRISNGDSVKFNQPGVISEICTDCDGSDQLNERLNQAVENARAAQTAANTALRNAETALAANPGDVALQAAVAAAQAELAAANAALAQAEADKERYSAIEKVVYMRDLNNVLHTVYHRNQIDHNGNNLSRFLSHDVGVRKIDVERKIENGQVVFYNHGGSIGRGYNRPILFGTPHNDVNRATGYVDAYLRDPASMGMSYNTFAVFASGFMRNTRDVNVGYQSIGKQVTELPKAGTAKYQGIAHAYINDLAAERYSNVANNQLTMDVEIHADFAKRSLGFNTRNTYIHTYETVNGRAEQHVVESRPDLNLHGSAGWNRDVGDFKGQVRNAEGNLTGELEGSFYGPKAAEVGGVFGLRGVDRADQNRRTHLVGGFSAKRD